MIFQNRITSIVHITRFRLTKHHSHNSVPYPTIQCFILQNYKFRNNTLPRTLSGTFVSSYSTGTIQEYIPNSSENNILSLQLSTQKISPQALPTNEAQIYLERMKNFLDTNSFEAITKEFIDLKQKNILPTLEIYHILLQMCHKTSDLNSALEIFAQIHADTTKSFVSPTRETYEYLLGIVEISSDHFLSLHVVKSIVNGQVPSIKSNPNKVRKNLGIKIDLNMWNFMLRSLTTQRKIYSTRDLIYFENVKELVKIFLNSNPNYHDFTEETWRLVIRALGAHPGNCKVFNEILRKIQSQEQIIMTPTIYSELIWTLSRKSLPKLAIENLDKLILQFNYIPSREPLYVLLSYYADLGNYQETEYLLEKYFNFITLDEQFQQPSSLQQKNWQFDFSTVLLKAYVQALRKEASFSIKNLEQGSEENEDNQLTKHNFTRNNFTQSSFYVSWKKLLNQVNLSNSKYHRDHFELMIRFQILSNQINHQEFPLNEALNMINEMKSDGIEPTFETFKTLLEGRAYSPEYNSSEPNLQRVEDTLKIFYMMKSSGYDVNNIEIFQALLDSCIPKHERFSGINHKSIYREIERKIVLIKSLIRVEPNQKSMLTLLELYGCIHSFNKMRHIWFDLLLSGYHRDLKFYKVFIKASSQDIRPSIYCLEVVRHQMSKEYPPVYPDLETYDLLLKCCIKSNDLVAKKQIINEMKQMKHSKKIGY